MVKVTVQSGVHEENPHIRFGEEKGVSAKPNLGFCAGKTIRMLLVAVAAIGAQMCAGETYYLSVGEKYVLCDASGWATEDGRVAGGEGDPLGTEDKFVIRGSKRLRTSNSNNASSSQTFTGAKLQVGDLSQSVNKDAKGSILHYSGGSCVVNYGLKKLVMQYADYDFENAKKCQFLVDGDMIIEGTSSRKTRIFNNAGYNDQGVTWQGDLIGESSSAYLQVGVDTARTAAGDKSFRLIFTGTTDFAGTIDVVAPTPSDIAPDFHEVLGLGGEVSGTVNLTTQNATLAIAGRGLSVGTLILADKSGLEFGDRSGLTVTTTYSSLGTVDLFFPDMSKIVTKDGAIHRISLMTVPSGTNLDADTFRIADAAMATVATLDIEKTGQGETLVLVQKALYANELQLTSDANDKTLNLPENALANAYYWEDVNGSRGEEHGSLDSAAAYCLRQNRTLRTPNSNEKSQSVTFNGGKLYLGDILQSADATRFGRIRHYSGLECVVDYGKDKLVFCYGDYVFQNAPRCSFAVKGDIQVDNTSSYPAKICNDAGNANQCVYWTGDLTGGPNSVLQVGNSNMRTTTDEFFRFWLLGSAADYLGVLNLVSDTDRSVARDFRVEFGLCGDFGGTLNAAAHTTLMSSSNAVSIANLSLAANSRLAVVGTRTAHTAFAVTETFSMVTPVEVSVDDPLSLTAMDGETCTSATVLTVPLGSGLKADDFVLCIGEMQPFFELKVEKTAATESLVLVQKVPVVKLVASDVVSKDQRSGGTIPPSAFETAASWSDNKLPHSGACYYAGADVVESGWAMIRSPQTVDYEFPGDSLTVGKNVFLLQCKNGLRIKKLQMLDGSCLHLEQQAENPSSFYGDELCFVSGTVYLSPFNAREWRLYPKITGAAEIYFRGLCGSTTRPDGSLSILGSMEDFLGTFRFGSKDLTGNATLTLKYPNSHNFIGTNFCAALPEFDYRAYVLSKKGVILPRTVNTTLAAESNRGLLVEEEGGTINCDSIAYGTFEIDWALTMDGVLTKDGPGTLAFGGAATQFIDANGVRGLAPVVGKNVLNVSNGTLRVTSVDALNGVAVTVAEGAELVVAPKAGDEEMLRYGWRNTRTDTPFTTAGQKLKADFSSVVVPPDGSDFTVALVTVSATAENGVRNLLPGDTLRHSGVKGYCGKLIRLVDEVTGDVTFAYQFTKQGLILIFR